MTNVERIYAGMLHLNIFKNIPFSNFFIKMPIMSQNKEKGYTAETQLS